MLTTQELELRKTGIGGSDIPIILGMSNYAKPIDLWRRKRGDVEELRTSIPIEVGNFLEPFIRNLYARETGLIVEGPFSTERNPDRPWQLFSLDGKAFRQEVQEDKRILEIKTAGLHKSFQFGEAGTDEIPPEYIAQVSWYMSATNIDRADVAALLTTNDFRVFHVERDAELEALILEAAERFWKLVESDTPPEPDGSDSYGRFIRDSFDKTIEVIEEQRADVNAQASALRRLSLEERRVASEIKVLKQKIQKAIGPAEGIETDQGTIKFTFNKHGNVNWKSVAEAIAETEGVAPDRFAAICDRWRGDAPRKLYLPRIWAKDDPQTKGE